MDGQRTSAAALYEKKERTVRSASPIAAAAVVPDTRLTMARISMPSTMHSASLRSACLMRAADAASYVQYESDSCYARYVLFPPLPHDICTPARAGLWSSDLGPVLPVQTYHMTMGATIVDAACSSACVLFRRRYFALAPCWTHIHSSLLCCDIIPRCTK